MVAKIKDLSVFIICRDEADRIGTTINSVLPWAGEIVVVDSGSEDDTVAIARGLGARVEHHDWEGYGPQKRYAESLCQGPWLMNLDADEEVSPQLADEIITLFADGEPPSNAYRIKIPALFNHETKPAWWAPTYNVVRLYHRDAGAYAASIVHDRVELKPTARVGQLAGPVYHRSFRSLAHVLHKVNAYSSEQNKDMQQKQRTVHPVRLLVEFPLAFFKSYFIRRYVFYGYWGFVLSVFYAFAKFLRIAKRYEQQLMARKKK